MNIPRIVIAGTNSGCGKTTLSMGIMAALVNRGLRVQPYKVGPDYIDPMFHTYITGNSSRNLDSWMLDEETVSYLFRRNAAGKDIAVIEGVMGFYDGYGGYSSTGSTAHVAGLIKAPVLLVVNGEGLSLSMAALISGFMKFDPGVNIQGVIINNIKSEHHFKLLKDVIEENSGAKAIGFLPRLPEFSLPSRHLGLVPGMEVDDLKDRINGLAQQIEKTIDIELLLKISQTAEELVDKESKIETLSECCNVTIGVPYDKAFNFYYRDNLDLFEMLGAKLEFFSPIRDTRIPKGVDGLYIGGGYPEVWAKELEDNASMRGDIKEKIESGLPVYAECGGLMYLSQEIKNGLGQKHQMVGVIPGRSEMTSSLKRFGYVDIEITRDNVLAGAGEKIRGHEFHYSITNLQEDIDMCYKITKSRRNNVNSSWCCGFKKWNVLAGYPHLHFWSNPSFARGFVESCKKYKNDI